MIFKFAFKGFDESDGNKRRSDEEGKEPAQATIIVICVLVVAFVVGVLMFLAYKNKHRYKAFSLSH